jgi:hypothetical protein
VKSENILKLFKLEKKKFIIEELNICGICEATSEE